MGRFINADAFAATGQGLLGNNMFAYCLNNPENMVDVTGTCGYAAGSTVWQNCGRVSCPYYSPTTVAAGISGSITLGPFVYGIQLAVVTDSLGYSEIQLTYFSPISSDALANTPSVDKMFVQAASQEKFTDILEFSLMGNLSFYNAPLAENLYSVGYQVGGSVGAGSAVAVDYNIIPNGSQQPYGGITISSGIGSSDVHAVMGVTRQLLRSPISVYDIANALHNAIYGR